VNTNAPAHVTYAGSDGATYTATLHAHPISKLLYYCVTRNGIPNGAILAESLRRTVLHGYKLPMPDPRPAATTIRAYDGRTTTAPTPRVSQFRALKAELQAREATR
jgi:hypothetical protein